MLLKNSFNVPLPPEQAWKVLLDIERIAPCMPGAKLTEVVDDRTYKGAVSVRLGPVALSFNGVAEFQEVDNDNLKAVVSGQGADAKGRGGANAVVSFQLLPVGEETTVDIETDLNMSGTVAQYGRGGGMIQSVATQLIGQFAKNLKAEIESSENVSGDAVETAGEPNAKEASPKPEAGTMDNSLSGFSLLFAAFRDWLAGLFRRKN